MLAQFQSLYPNGSIISELVQIFQGKYIVRVSVQIAGITRATAMAAAETVEVAEDLARERALIVLGIPQASEKIAKVLPKPISLEQQNPPLVTTSDLHETTDVIDSQWSVAKNQQVSPNPTIEPDQNLVSGENGIQGEGTGNNYPENYQKNSDQSLNPNFSGTTYQEPETDTLVKNTGNFSSNHLENMPLLGNTMSNVTPFVPRNYNTQEDTGKPSGIGKRKKQHEPVNLSDVIAKTDVEIERLGWTKEQGRDYLKQTYGKLGRSLLSEAELLDFLKYLETQPDPLSGF